MVPSWQELLSVKRNYWVIPLLPVFYLLFGPKKREEEKGMCILGLRVGGLDFGYGAFASSKEVFTGT